jgi:uncharacterized Zn finger protein
MHSIACDFGKQWHSPDICEYEYEGRKCYKCNSKDNLEVLTNPSWWDYYYKCVNCNTVYNHSYGDKMGGQSDDVSISNMDDVVSSLHEYMDWYELKNK